MVILFIQDQNCNISLRYILPSIKYYTRIINFETIDDMFTEFEIRQKAFLANISFVYFQIHTSWDIVTIDLYSSITKS
jgi:hypothetical protein